jgi:hypothetical protein
LWQKKLIGRWRILRYRIRRRSMAALNMPSEMLYSARKRNALLSTTATAIAINT